MVVESFMVTNSNGTTTIRSNQQQQPARQWKQQSAKQGNRTAAELHGTIVQSTQQQHGGMEAERHGQRQH
jgi:hypothetical protein